MSLEKHVAISMAIRGFLIYPTIVAVILVGLSFPVQNIHAAQSWASATYLRHIEFRITDLAGQPLAGVTAEINPQWGRLTSPAELVSDQDGIIRLAVQPVVEEPHLALATQDRFIYYRCSLTYRLTKTGYLERRDRIDDEQEQATFADPLYDHLDRQPTGEILVINQQLSSYGDFVTGPKGKSFQSLIKTVYRENRDYALLPATLDLTPAGVLTIGLEFGPRFDPGEFGLRAAGAALLAGPIRDCLKLARDTLAGFDGVTQLEFIIAANFQSRLRPNALPVTQTFAYRFPRETALKILASPEKLTWPLGVLEVKVETQGIDLGPEFAAAW